MPIGDVYQITLNSRWGTTETMANVFYYEQTAGVAGNSAAQLGVGFNAFFVPDLRVATTYNITYTTAQVINYGDLTDSVVQNIQQPGLRGTTPDVVLPAYIGWSIRAPIDLPGQRYSYKRFSGVRVLDIEFNGHFTDDFELAMSQVAESAGENIVQGGNTYRPVQVPSAKTLGVPLVVNRTLIGDWEYNDYMSTQNTRKDAFYDWKLPA